MCSELEPFRGELQKMHLTALWWTLSKYVALVNNICSLLYVSWNLFRLELRNSFLTLRLSTAADRSTPNTLGWYQKLKGSFQLAQRFFAAKLINILQCFWTLPMTKEIIVTVKSLLAVFTPRSFWHRRGVKIYSSCQKCLAARIFPALKKSLLVPALFLLLCECVLRASFGAQPSEPKIDLFYVGSLLG